MKYSARYQRQFDFIDTEAFFTSLKGKLDEMTLRLVVAAMTEAGGHFNLTHISRCADVSRPVIYSGISDLQAPQPGIKPNGERVIGQPAGVGVIWVSVLVPLCKF